MDVFDDSFASGSWSGGDGWIAAAILAVALAVCLLVLVLTVLRLFRREAEFRREHRQGLDRSRSVLMGQVAEHMLPLLGGFPWEVKDARFLGQPVDYLVFRGLEALHDGTGDGKMEIIFCEVKTGQSRLSRSEAAIRDAVCSGRVGFRVLRVEPDGRITTGE